MVGTNGSPPSILVPSVSSAINLICRITLGASRFTTVTGIVTLACLSFAYGYVITASLITRVPVEISNFGLLLSLSFSNSSSTDFFCWLSNSVRSFSAFQCSYGLLTNRHKKTRANAMEAMNNPSPAVAQKADLMPDHPCLRQSQAIVRIRIKHDHAMPPGVSQTVKKVPLRDSQKIPTQY